MLGCMSDIQDSIKYLFDSVIDEFERDPIEAALNEARSRMELADNNLQHAAAAQPDSVTRQLLLSTALLHEQRVTNLLALVTLEASYSRLA